MLFSSHLHVPFSQWMQTWGVLRYSLDSKGGREGEDSVVLVQSQVTAFGNRGSGWQVFMSAVLLQKMSHSCCQLWCAHYMPVILSNTLVAILHQAPCPIFCWAWNHLNFATHGTSIQWSGLISHLKCLQLQDNLPAVAGFKVSPEGLGGWAGRAVLQTAMIWEITIPNSCSTGPRKK